MKVKVKFIEMIWDNYQGASGTPIVRDVLFHVSDDTELRNLISIILNKLTAMGIKRGYDESESQYPLTGIISIEILPTFTAI